MRNDQALRAVHLNIDLFFLGVQKDTSQCGGKRVIKRLAFLFQRNDTCFQTRGFNHSLHEKIQFIKLGGLCCKKLFLLLHRDFIFKQGAVNHFQVRNRGLDLMGNIRNKFLQVSPLLCNAVLVFLHDFIQTVQPIFNFIEKTFFFHSLFRLHIPGQHIIHQTAKSIGEHRQFAVNQHHKTNRTKQHKDAEQ